ncbi:MAG: tetratricopeptide repeat protein [Cyanobacteriota bacterium]|nr:tetratricopeptide repeat protein [Cyanobacteriota bacterium]
MLDIEKNGKVANPNSQDARIILQPNLAHSHYHLGQVLAKQEQWEKAIASYRQALQIQPSSDIYLSLAESLVRVGKEAEAISSYQKAIEQQPNLAIAYHNLADLLQKQGNLKKAVSAYRQAILLEPKFHWSHNNLGDALRDLERWQEAIEAYQMAIELNPDFAWSHYNLAEAAMKLEDWQTAEASYRKALQLDPNLVWAYSYLGDVLVSQKRYSEAIECYEKAIELEPNIHVSVYQNLGEALEKVKQIEKLQTPPQKLSVRSEPRQQSPGKVEGDRNTITTEAPIILFTPYYKAKDPERQEELVYCLQKNIECDQIDKIVLVIDDNHVPELDSSKIEIIKVSARPTYLDWVELTQEKGKNVISILANTDIHFNESIARIRKVFSSNSQAFMALSRYEKEGTNYTLHKNPHWSQDVWAISGKYQFTSSLKNSLKVSLGVPRCDNKIAYLFTIHGAQVYNPCHQIQTVHVQESQLRYYSKYGDTSIVGGTAWVYPSVLVDEPAKLKIDLWTLNASDVTGVQINNTWESLNKKKIDTTNKSPSPENPEQKTSSKIQNIIAFNSEWQYPAITEKYAYEMVEKFLTGDHYQTNVIYFGFPWATLIDKSLHGKNPAEAEALREKLLEFKDELKQYKRVITVCQHVRMLEFESLFSEVGVTDIFWSHAIKEQQFLPTYPYISLHPFPLYPVQAMNYKTANLDKKYLYSFVGARATKSYMTDLRNKMIDYLSEDDRGLIIQRERWHYNKIVYDRQILNQTKESETLVDLSASEEFKQIMQQSVFALCPSGSGPNSIRLWEAMGFGVIPVILADTYLPPGDLTLWYEATVMCPETFEDIKALPARLAKIQQDEELLAKKRRALQQLWSQYGPDCFVYDIAKLFFQYALGKVESVRTKIKTPNLATTIAKTLQTTKTTSAPQATTETPKSEVRQKALKKKVVTKETFKSSYTWPNPIFPFRLYYDSPQCRIFIIENIQHNWNWLSQCHQGFRKTDFFFVMAGWYQSPQFAEEAQTIFSVLNLDKSQFFFMYNSSREMRNFAEKGFQGDVINQNAWIDEKTVLEPKLQEKVYDAIYVEFEKKYKRPQLADRISKLALVTRGNPSSNLSNLPPHQYINQQQLSPPQIHQKMTQSSCGLILSEQEGACSTVSEYLLCGIPIISTPALGGRDVWCDEYNSIICEPTSDAVAAAVKRFTNNPPEAQKIRRMYIAKAEEHREKFIHKTAEVFDKFEVTPIDSASYFQKNFYHKMRKNENINVVKSLFY